MAPRVNVVCQNPSEDRILPRMARALRDALGWTLTAAPDGSCDIVYLLAYFEAQRLRGSGWPSVPVAAYFTHREEEPGNAKSRLYDRTAERVQLRVAMCRKYADPLSAYGPTITPPLPVESDRFTLPTRKRTNARPVVGLSGYTYLNHRKGEDLVRGLVASEIGRRVEWLASGRGWPVRTRRFTWAQMPQFYQSLDVLVCASRVEGGPLPVLEALSCGVRVVVPRGVGIIDELPDVPGIYRYERGDLPGLTKALERAAYPKEPIEREALRAAVAGHTVEAFVEAHRAAFAELSVGATLCGRPIAVTNTGQPHRVAPTARVTSSTRGIYCVAFGEPARAACRRMMDSARRHMPDVPIALCAAKPIGPEDVLVIEPDSDVGGRRAKLKAYENTPAEWQSVLYLDADTEVTAPVYRFFEWIEDGWDLAICTDVPPNDEVDHALSRLSKDESRATTDVVGTPRAVQFNGGVWSFGRNERVAGLFARWRMEWERFGAKDQCALLRALYAAPLRVWVLGNEWNTFPKLQPRQATAGVLHFPGDARRWKERIVGRIDSPAAWAAVQRYERGRR